MPTFDPRQEPSDPIERAVFWQAYLDQAREFWPLTREAQQMWSIAELARATGFPQHLLRKAYQQGKILMAQNISGTRGIIMPRSSAIIVIGQIISGTLKLDDDEAQQRSSASA